MHRDSKIHDDISIDTRMYSSEAPPYIDQLFEDNADTATPPAFLRCFHPRYVRPPMAPNLCCEMETLRNQEVPPHDIQREFYLQGGKHCLRMQGKEMMLQEFPNGHRVCV